MKNGSTPEVIKSEYRKDYIETIREVNKANMPLRIRILSILLLLIISTPIFFQIEIRLATAI